MRKKVIIGIISTFSALCATLGIVGMSQSNNTVVSVVAEKAEFQTTLKSEYYLGEELLIPEAVFTYEGVDYVADEAYLEMPDENVYNQESYVLSMLGEHTVLYSTTVDNMLLKGEKTFKVIQKNFEVSSDNSQAVFLEQLERAQVVNDVATPGIHVDLKKGDSFYCNQPISIADSEQPVITLYPYTTIHSTQPSANNPNGGWYYDSPANRLVVRLTDCYDETNYVEIAMDIISSNAKNLNYSDAIYAKARCNGQEFAAMEVAKNTNQIMTYYDGEGYRIWYGMNYGKSITWGTTEYKKPLKLYYDVESTHVYIDGGGGKKLINILGTDEWNDISFKGFTTNEVKVSMYADFYEEESHTVEISQIGENIGEQLTYSDYQDFIAPTITINTNFKSDKKYYVARGEEIVIPTATVTDINAKGGVTARVFYDYYSSAPVSVFVKDGKFIPDKLGDFTIVYTAEDLNGNKTEKLINVTAVDVDNNGGKTVCLNTDKIENLVVGQNNLLPEYSITTLNDESVDLRIYAIYQAEETMVQEININDRSFFVDKIGKYEIVYEYAYALETKTYSYTVDSISNGKTVIFANELHLPEYFIKNATYSLDALKAFDFSGESGKEVAIEYFVSEDEGEFVKIDYSAYAVGATNTVQFKYTSANADDAFSPIMPVVDVGFKTNDLAIEKYFVGNGLTVTASSSMQFFVDGNAKDAEAKFVNAISLSMFSVSFRTKGITNFTALEFVLTDYYNRSNEVILSIQKQNEGLSFSINNGTKFYSTTDFNTSGRVNILYDAETNKFELENLVIDCPSKFISDKALFSIRVKGNSAESEFDVFEINGQQLNGATRDNGDPYITCDNSQKGNRSFGDLITICPAIYGDVLSPTVFQNAYIQVVLPNGEYAKSVDGVTLDGTSDVSRSYELLLNEYGMYRVVYGYVDQSDREATVGFVMYVKDFTAPTLEINNGYTETTLVSKKLNSQETIADVIVSDDFGVEGVTISIMVMSPKNTMTFASVGDKITLDEVGIWRICYYCYDQEGNNVMRYYQIEVA